MPSYVVKDCNYVDALAYVQQRKLVRESSGKLWVAYHRSDGTTYQIYVSYSVNGGVDWAEEQVTYKTGSDHQAYPSLAIDSNDDLHLVWYGTGWGTNSTYDNIQYRKRTSEGWQTQEAVTDKNGSQAEPVIAIDSSNNVHVAWYGYGWGSYPAYNQVQYRKRTTSWQTQEAITDKNGSQYDMAIAIDSSDNVHVIWHGYGWGSNPTYENIEYRKRTTSWQAQEAVTDKNASQGLFAIAIDSSDYVHVVWHGQGWGSYPTDRQIQYRKRTTSWQAQEALTNVDMQQYDPSIAIDADDYVHVVWFGHGWGTKISYYNIQYRKRTTSWQTQVGITDVAADQIWCNLIWALHPSFDGIKTNRTKTGYTFVWMAVDVLKYHASSDLAWQVIKALDGTIAGESTLSGVLSATWLITGTIAAESTTSGILKREQMLAGAIAITSGTTGSVKVTSEIAGTVAAESATTGDLTGDWRISGIAEAQAVVSGSIQAVWKLSGTVTGESSVTALLSRTRKIAGTPVVCGLTIGGELKIANELTGAVTAESVVSGNIKIGKRLAGAVAAASAVSGSIKRIRSVSRTTPLKSSLTGELTVAELVGVVTVQSTVGGSIKVTKKVTATVVAECTVSGALTVGMVGTITIQSVVTGLMKPVRKLTGTIVTSSVTSGVVQVSRKLVSTSAASSNVSGSIVVVYKLATTAPIVSGASGVLTKTVSVAGTIASQCAVTGVTKITKEFVVTVAASSITVGLMKVTCKIIGVTISSTCVVTGDLITEVFYDGTVSIQSTIGGTVKISKHLVVAVTCNCLVAGSAKLMKKLVSVPIAGTCSVSGELYWPVTVPQFNIVSAIKVLPIFSQDCRVNEKLRRVSVTHGYAG